MLVSCNLFKKKKTSHYRLPFPLIIVVTSETQTNGNNTAELSVLVFKPALLKKY